MLRTDTKKIKYIKKKVELNKQKKNDIKNKYKKIIHCFTSQPVPGVGPSQFGGGPPYFLCPVVTSKG